MKSAVSIFPFLFFFGFIYAQPYSQAHAHNDYAHKYPLQEALNHGFTSVEADIFLIRNKLVVAHIRPILKKKRTLRELYLEPLQKRSQEEGGKIYSTSTEPFTLMIDFKKGGQAMYERLKIELQEFAPLLCRWENGKYIPGPVKIVLSGGRPSAEQVAQEENRYVWLDGRPGDFEHQSHKNEIAWVSDRYGKHFSWKGKGPMPESEKQKLTDFVNQAHKRNAQVRFWASPENEKVWKTLLEAGVDRISTDELEGFADFLQSQKP